MKAKVSFQVSILLFGLFSLASLLCLSGCAKKSAVESGEKFPSRIVALSPSAAEVLFAVGAGAQVVAVSDYTDFPPEACSLPKAGGFDGKTLSMESILSFKPDFVYLTQGMHNFLIPMLQEYSIDYYISNADSIKSVEQEILEVAALTGHEDSKQVKTLIKNMEEKLAAAEKIRAEHSESPALYYEVWNSPFITAGKSSFINDVIEKAGAVNIFSDLEEAYPIISEESIIKRNPSVILISKSSALTAEDIQSRYGWKDISALKNNQIFIIDDNVFTRPGPRIADCVASLSHLLYDKE